MLNSLDGLRRRFLIQMTVIALAVMSLTMSVSAGTASAASVEVAAAPATAVAATPVLSIGDWLGCAGSAVGLGGSVWGFAKYGGPLPLAVLGGLTGGYAVGYCVGSLWLFD